MADPMWRQIAESLRVKIESGELGGDGRPLPSELELREEYGASRNTIRDAVKWLVTRGLVVTKPGQGTFVVKKIDPFVTTMSVDIDSSLGAQTAAYLSEVTAKRRTPFISQPRVEIQQAPELVAGELNMVPGDTIVSRHQERFIDNIPWSLQTSFYPMRLVQEGALRLIQAEDITEGGVSYIEETLGVNRKGRRDLLKVRAPDRRETDFFGLPDDGRVAVFEINQTVYDETGAPFVLTVTTYPSDRNAFVIAVGEVPQDVAPLGSTDN